MKVRFTIEQKPIMGYLNIDPFPQISPEEEKQYNITRTNFSDIDKTLFDAECIEIILDTILDRMNWDKIYQFLVTICKKLKHNGILIIQSLDLWSIINAYINGEITTPELNTLIYGNKQSPWNVKSSQICMTEIAEILVSLGLTIEEQSYEENYTCIIKGRRP